MRVVPDCLERGVLWAPFLFKGAGEDLVEFFEDGDEGADFFVAEHVGGFGDADLFFLEEPFGQVHFLFEVVFVHGFAVDGFEVAFEGGFAEGEFFGQLFLGGEHILEGLEEALFDLSDGLGVVGFACGDGG